MCVGSIGQGPSQPDYVDNMLFDNINLFRSSNAAWIKTYHGTGHGNNVTFRNIEFSDVNQPIYLTTCIYSARNFDSSKYRSLIFGGRIYMVLRDTMSVRVFIPALRLLLRI
jgi:hypothetical protein